MQLLCVALFTVLWPAGASQSASTETLVEVRIHGNHRTPDAEVVRMAGVTVGAPLAPGATQGIAARLRSSGRFARVEVRKRYRSLASTGEVALVVIIEEAAGRTGNPIARPFGWMRERFMFLPLLNYRDGYGFSYGVRTSLVDIAGARSRASVPLTWGATKRAALEVDKAFTAGWLHRVEGGVSITEEEHPHFLVDDQRVQVWGRVERRLAPDLRLGAGVGWQSVALGDLDDRLVSYGADLTFDTRIDRTFPRDAVYAAIGWEGMRFETWPSAQRVWMDARGYVGLVRQSVLSVRARYEGASRALPPIQQPILGGAASLRGFRAGSFVGDNLLTGSVELRLPMTSPLDVGRMGLTLFWDGGAVYAEGERLGRARLHHGAGVGVFLLAPPFRLNADVAHGFDNRWRLHVMTGFAF